MRTLVALTTLLVTGCGMPYWDGSVPPLDSRADPCGSGALTQKGVRALQRIPFLQSAYTDGATVAWAGMPRPETVVEVARGDDATREVVVRVPGTSVGADPNGEAVELHEDYDDTDPDGATSDDKDDDKDDDVVEAEDFFRLAARIEHLPPETAGYCYRLVSANEPLTEWASLTLAQPAGDERIDRFVLLGDTGNGHPAQRAIAARIASEPMDAVIFLGDIAYTSGTHEQLQARFFDVYASLLQRIPVYAVIGNHDNRTQRGKPFEEAFVLPGNERWYSFDLGDVHFVALDTTRIGREQARWLEADLAKTERKFTVVVGHHPPYTAAWRGSSRGFRRWFVPVLERHHVELVVTGHEHHYERTKPLDGIVYIVSGGGGAHLQRTGWKERTAVAHAKHHFLTMEVRADALVVRAIDIDGHLLDTVVVSDRR
ncbi:MAG: metallophosphoesterase [Kofleriaceae bacterium]|nr:metallophosphoesterase [Kofleriaceae bacterium]